MKSNKISKYLAILFITQHTTSNSTYVNRQTFCSIKQSQQMHLI